MKTEVNATDERQQTRAQFERLGLFFDQTDASCIDSSFIAYTKNWNQLSFGLVLKQAIHLHTQWKDNEKMLIDEQTQDHKTQGKKKKSKQLVLDKKNIPEEFQNDAELLKYWLQRYRLFSKFDDGVLLDRG
jgi:hypothetical protein